MSTVARLVKTLEALGALERIPGTTRYQLGMQLYYLGKVVEDRMEVRELARPVLNQLSQSTGESADLYIRDGDHRVCIAQALGNLTVRHQVPIGRRMPLWAGSAGAVFMAHATPGEISQVLAAAYSLTPRTILDASAWEARLARVRHDGYAVSFEEREVGVASVSAPVFRADGTLAAVVGISAPAPRLAPDTLPGQVKVVQEAAAQLSAMLGFRTR